MVQWLRLRDSNSEGLDLIPGQGTRSHMPQLKPKLKKINKIYEGTLYSLVLSGVSQDGSEVGQAGGFRGESGFRC